jgi:phenylpyruvate tautomerase PptA (4-oxalocrotonate tautomerase family)
MFSNAGRMADMPLVYVELIEGRSQAQVKALLDSIHRAVVDAFAVPERDRYQLVTSRRRDEVIALDTGLGIERSDQLVIIRMVSRKRTDENKRRLYQLLAEYLQHDCGLAPTDLIVTIVDNGDADWSFGLGRAQFLEGELT